MSLIQIRNCSLASVRNSEFGKIDKEATLISVKLGERGA